MDLRGAILQEHSKAQMSYIVKWVGSNPARLDQLVSLFENDEYRVVQRASWPLSEIARLCPDLFEIYIPALLDKLSEPGTHPAVKRNIFRIFESIPIPEEYHGIVLDYSFRALEDNREALAVRAFSVTIISKLVVHYPDIIPEFKMILEDELETNAPPSFVSRAKRVLKQFGKMR